MGPRAFYTEATDQELPLPLSWVATANPFDRHEVLTSKTVHRFCRDRERCTGPGCVITTGKTRTRPQRPYRGLHDRKGRL